MTALEPRTAGALRPARRADRVPVRPAALALGLALAGTVVVAVTMGPAELTVPDVLRSVLAHLGAGTSPLPLIEDNIVWHIRLPRVLTAGAVGAGLAVSGAVMQALTRNSLADPYLLGLSSGASLGAVAVLLLGLHLLLPLAAFAGALLALGTTLLLARLAGGLTPARTVLAGVAVSSLGTALTSLLIFWTATGDSYRDIMGWLMGSLSGARWSGVLVVLPVLVLALVPLLAAAPVLDGFAFGDSAAAALGINVPAARWFLLVAAALLTGVMVSVSGAIGFVGLVLPHAVRLVAGPGHRALLPLSALLGAVFLIWADTLARTVLDPRELPVGVVTAVVGAPVFALLLARRQGPR
ncbi:UNVERIFIED_CONTAM: iron chelate uptake ABC transporter family permease subunit [Kocuria sp. CPCC 205316]|uniref:putative F420-0 ABC transporter permease subunit n=1 Tax=Kocuria TaxID=57493 RepID=UPI0036DEF673